MESILILDGYTDEPSALGVPPYLAPLPRYCAGAVRDFDPSITISYRTIDDFRNEFKSSSRADRSTHPTHGKRHAKTRKHMRSAVVDLSGAAEFLSSFGLIVVISGCIVPGKYLNARPISTKEISAMAETAPCEILVLGAGAPFIPSRDLPGNVMVAGLDGDAALFDHLESALQTTDSHSYLTGRRRTMDEWDRWAVNGASIVEQHPGFPHHIIAELEPMRGCVRQVSGGCSFCAEPGRPLEFRAPAAIIKEAAALRKCGIRNFRLGGSDIFSYCAEDAGKSERPEPNPHAVEELLSGIAALNPEVFHLDNANPAQVAAFPEQSREILHTIVKFCTSGNGLSLGLESADPAVREANNLNASAEETMAAIRMINEIGATHGASGLPALLPGLNFLAGLHGETEQTYELNRAFLQKIVDEGLILRRINIRQVLDYDNLSKSQSSHSKQPNFADFKKFVREKIDHVMLQRLLPHGTIVRAVHIEKRDGAVSFGRQIGTYPVLVGIPYPLPIGTVIDARIFSWGQRSVTGVAYPFDLNTATLKEIAALPELGKKRAIRVIMGRPYENCAAFEKAIDDVEIARRVWEFAGMENVLCDSLLV